MTRNDIAAIRAHHPCHSAGTCDLCDLISEVLRLRAVADRVRDLANRAEPDTWVSLVGRSDAGRYGLAWGGDEVWDNWDAVDVLGGRLPRLDCRYRVPADAPVKEIVPDYEVVAFVDEVLDGWVLRAILEAGEDGPEIAAIELRRRPGGQPVGTRVLRRLGLGAAVSALNRLVSDPAVARRLSSFGPGFAQAVRRPGRRGTDHRLYAVVAARYVRALGVNPRAPYRVMVDEARGRGEYETESALRSKVQRARSVGVLTPAEGRKPGGSLTQYGEELAAEMGEEV